MLDREKLRARLDRQSARDDTRRRHWQEHRRQRIIGGMENPVLPAFCRVCLAGMIGGALMAATGDLATPGRGSPRSAAVSALVIWLVFGLGLAAGCLIQLRRGFDHPWYAAHRLNRRGRPRMPWAVKYLLWLAVFAGGAAALGLLSAIIPR